MQLHLESVIPSKRHRLLVALFIGSCATLVRYASYRAAGHWLNGHGDFGIAWFGARALRSGLNPYELIGPGRQFDFPWPAVYPATAFVVALPFSVLSELVATQLFVFVSFGILSYAMTADGWYRLPLFLSFGAIAAASVAQWTPLMTAGIGIPLVGTILVAKPSEGIAIALAGGGQLKRFALIGALCIGLISLLYFPRWLTVWFEQLHYATQMSAPILRPGGFAIILAVLRWRRPEARLILLVSLIPAVGYWYTMLPLFWVPKTRSEAMVLSITTSLGWLIQDWVVTARNEVELNAQVGALIVAASFLPSVAMVIRRPNKGEIG